LELLSNTKEKKTFQWLHVAKMEGHKSILEKDKNNTKQGVLYTMALSSIEYQQLKLYDKLVITRGKIK
jgi:hypothetical protein